LQTPSQSIPGLSQSRVTSLAGFYGDGTPRQFRIPELQTPSQSIPELSQSRVNPYINPTQTRAEFYGEGTPQQIYIPALHQTNPYSSEVSQSRFFAPASPNIIPSWPTQHDTVHQSHESLQFSETAAAEDHYHSLYYSESNVDEQPEFGIAFHRDWEEPARAVKAQEYEYQIRHAAINPQGGLPYAKHQASGEAIHDQMRMQYTDSVNRYGRLHQLIR
jgi:hypothetical protein